MKIFYTNIIVKDGTAPTVRIIKPTASLNQCVSLANIINRRASWLCCNRVHLKKGKTKKGEEKLASNHRSQHHFIFFFKIYLSIYFHIDCQLLGIFCFSLNNFTQAYYSLIFLLFMLSSCAVFTTNITKRVAKQRIRGQRK